MKTLNPCQFFINSILYKVHEIIVALFCASKVWITNDLNVKRDIIFILQRRLTFFFLLSH